MAKGSVKLSILSTFDDKGEKAAERAMTRFTKEYGTAVQTQSGSILTLDSVSAALAQQSIEADQLAAKWSKTSATLTSAGSALTMGVTVPLVAVGAAAVNTAIDFESSMSQLAGALNVPISQTEELKQLAIDTGNSTIYSAQEAAQAMTELAKGGLTEADIEGGALAATMALAAAGGLDLADAGDTIVQAMGAFSMTADESSTAANALAGAANASSADVTDLSQGLSQCAAQASNAGWDIEQTTAVLAAFADNGIKGSDAGTSLKTALQRLAAPTDEAAASMEEYGINVRDSNGNMLGAADVAQVLQTQLGGLTSAQRDSALQTIFGSDATRAATVLMKEGATGIEEYVSATSDQTAAQRMADAQMGDSERAIENMKGALETAGIQIGEAFAPTVASLATAVGNLAEDFSNLSPKQKDTIIKFAALAAAAGPVVKGVSGIAGAGKNVLSIWGDMTAAFAKSTAATYAQIVAEKGEATAITTTKAELVAKTAVTETATAATKAAKVAMEGLAVAGVGLLVAAIASDIDATTKAKEAQERYNSAMQTAATVMGSASSATGSYVDAATSSYGYYTAAADEAVTSTQNLIDKRQEYLNGASETASTLATNSGALDTYLAVIEQLEGHTGLTAGEQAQLAAAVAGVNEICGTSISVLDGQNGKLSMQYDTIRMVTDAYKDYAEAQAYQELYTEAIKNQAEAQKEYDQAQTSSLEIIDSMPASYKEAAMEIFATGDATGDNAAQLIFADQATQDAARSLAQYHDAMSTAQDTVNGYSGDIDYYTSKLGESADTINASVDAQKQYIESNQAMMDSLNAVGATSDTFATSLHNIGLSTSDVAQVSDETWQDIISTYGTSEDAIMQGLEAHGVDVAALAKSNGTSAADEFADGLSGAATSAMQAANSVSGQTVAEFQASVQSYGITGNDAITAYANAIAAGNSPEVAAQQALDVQLGLSSQDSAAAGNQVIRDWYTGMSSEEQNAVLTAAGVAGISVQQLYDNYNAAGGAGSGTILDYANGITSQQQTANDSAYDVSATSAAALIGDGSGQGAWLGSTYAGGIGGQSGNANAQGSAVANSAASGLQSQNGNSYWWGNELGNNLGDGLFAAVDYVGSGADRIADRIWSVLHFTLPEYGPLADMDTWVPDMADMYVGGLEDMADRTHAAALDVANGVSNGLQVDAKYSASAGNMRARNATCSTPNVYNISATIDASSLADVQTVEDMLDRINRSNANAQLRAARAS